MSSKTSLDVGTGVLTLAWVMGMVLVKGFWPMFFAIIVPPYAWYITVEFFLHYFNVL